MKKVNNMSELFDKLNDLKAVFTYGQKIIPVLQSLIDFMRDTVPLLETVNNSIAESTRQIPKASHHINDVTNATELATTEILDIVDIISNDMNYLHKDIKDEIVKLQRRDEIFKELTDQLPKTDHNTDLLNEYAQMNASVEAFEKMAEVLDVTRNNVFNITLSLQVQDITSQQLVAVNHLIESVQEKLAGLIYDLETNDFENDLEALKISAPQNAAYNPDAKYDKSGNQQSLADDLVKNNSAQTSQDEIDKLFS